MFRLRTAALLLLLLFTVSCGVATQHFTGDNGATITIQGPWSQFAPGDYDELYEDGAVDRASISLALGRDRGETGYFTLRIQEAGAELDELADFLSKLEEYAATDRSQTEERLEAAYGERVLERLEPVLAGKRISDDDYLLLLQEIYLERRLLPLLEDPKLALEILPFEELRISGRPVQVAHFAYKNKQGMKLRHLTACVVRGDLVYELDLWATAEQLDSWDKEARDLLASLRLPGETVPSTTETDE
ncbi:MAG: hypothetical protein QM296_12595 [Bacillota bacterium]|nr:hypothetical protein [Bacillota bacterium]